MSAGELYCKNGKDPGRTQYDTMVKGRRINGQKMFLQIIAGTAGIVVIDS